MANGGSVDPRPQVRRWAVMLCANISYPCNWLSSKTASTAADTRSTGPGKPSVFAQDGDVEITDQRLELRPSLHRPDIGEEREVAAQIAARMPLEPSTRPGTAPAPDRGRRGRRRF